MMINKIKEFMNLSAMAGRWQGYTVTFEDFTPNIQILFNPVVLAKHGYGISSIFRFTDGALCVFIDRRFMKLSPLAQRFFYFHEEGHNELKHYEMKPVTSSKRILSAVLSSVNQMEIDADIYAAKQVGFDVAINALEESINVSPFFASIELRKRIIMLSSIRENYKGECQIW